MRRLLVLHPALAPYRIDLFNALHESFNAIFYFYTKQVSSQNFNQNRLIHLLNFAPKFLKYGIPLGYRDRVIRFGILHKILKYKPEIILCSEYSITTFKSILYTKMFMRKTKVYTLCDDSLQIAKDTNGIRKLARAIIIRWIDGVILCNNAVESWYKKTFPKIKTVTFPIIQDEVRLRKDLFRAIDSTTMDMRFKELEAYTIFLYVGRFAPEKNLIFLIHAFSEYLNVADQASKLILIGDGELREELVRLTKKINVSESIIFPGRFEAEELYRWYHVADALILPSIYEPFGAVVNEALIFEDQVICSEVAGATCLINADNGFVFNPHDKNELINILVKLKKKSKNGQHLMAFNFSEKIAELLKFLNS
ncbi:glycosyltransferase [Saccharicrinis sp. FJH62]|uniref:glycosyltransferase n=1 Tax=Saccharicrinis sp. FJH62 TaxID=3344657 RepID=UPI0035D523AD